MTRLALVVAITGLAFAAAASAGVTKTSGHATEIAAPTSVKPGALQSNTTINVFEEQQCVRLSAPLRVDITNARRISSPNHRMRGVVPAGTVVSSQFVHVDPVGRTLVRLTGSVTTDAKILGLIVDHKTLDASDFLGAAGTQYPKGDSSRQMEFLANDVVTLSEHRRTVDIASKASVHIDQLRIITECGTADQPGAKREGCSASFWRTHLAKWTGYAPTDRFEAVFGVDAFTASATVAVNTDPTLLEALNLSGSGVNSLARQAVAALLNASSPDVKFSLTAAEVISMTANAIKGGKSEQVESVEDQFERLNMKRCHLR